MSIVPIITFKAGQCEVDSSHNPYKVTPIAKPGYIYLYSEDDLMHFCWRERGAPMDQPELDLMMVPTDGHFIPYEYKTTDRPTSRTNGRIFVLKFSSSSQRHLFWLQSKSQSRNGDPRWFSTRDLKIGQIVDSLLQGEEVDVSSEIAQVQTGDHRDDDDDETMEDIEGHEQPGEHHQGGGGGAGPDATGGDVREEGEQAREGGADGARAASASNTDAATVVQNFLDSLKGNQNLALGSGAGQALASAYTTLPDLLPARVTIPVTDACTSTQVDHLLSCLPPTVFLLAQESASHLHGLAGPSTGSTTAALETSNLNQKKTILRRVLRSPQFHQSLWSLTIALRDGGLPSIAEALGIRLENGGLVKGGSVPLGGGDAVEAFVEGVKKAVQVQGD